MHILTLVPPISAISSAWTYNYQIYSPGTRSDDGRFQEKTKIQWFCKMERVPQVRACVTSRGGIISIARSQLLHHEHGARAHFGVEVMGVVRQMAGIRRWGNGK